MAQSKVEILIPFNEGQTKGDIIYMKKDEAIIYQKEGVVLILDNLKNNKIKTKNKDPIKKFENCKNEEIEKSSVLTASPVSNKISQQKYEENRIFFDLFYKKEYGTEEYILFEFEEYIRRKSITDKILFILLENPLPGDIIKKHNLLLEDKETTIWQTKARAKNNKLIMVLAQDWRNKTYSITKAGKKALEKTFNEFLREHKTIKKNIEINILRGLNIKSSTRAQDFSQYIIDNEIKLEIESPKISIRSLFEYSKKTGSELYNLLSMDYTKSMKALNLALEKNYTEFIKNKFEENQANELIRAYKSKINNILLYDFQDENIDIEKLDILNITEKQENKLLVVRGFLVEKNPNIIYYKKIIYKCNNADCEHIETTYKDTPPAKCKACKTEDSFEEIERKEGMHTFLELENLDMGKRIRIEVHGANIDIFDRLQLGEEIEVIGTIKKNGFFKDNKTELIFEANNYEFSKKKENLTQEQITNIEHKIKIGITDKNKTPREYILHHFKLFPYAETIKLITIIPHLLNFVEHKENFIYPMLISSPGQLKSEFLNFIAKITYKGKKINFRDISEPKLKGSLNSNTQIKEIGILKKYSGGSLTIDELDKMSNLPEQGKLFAGVFNELLSHQTVTKEKSGISISEQALNIRFACAMNFTQRGTEQKPTYDMLVKYFAESSFISRLIPLYIEKLSKEEINKATENKNSGFYKSFLDNVDYDFLQDLFLYLRTREVDFGGSEIATNYIRKIKIPEQLTEIRIRQMMSYIIIALTRLNLKKIPTEEEVKQANTIYIDWLDNMDLQKKPEPKTETTDLSGEQKTTDQPQPQPQQPKTEPEEKNIRNDILNFIKKGTETDIYELVEAMKEEYYLEPEIFKEIQKLKKEGVIFEPRKSLFMLVE